jgi:fructose-1,6-bisphosphatase/inositol monophosphatase family enzyme
MTDRRREISALDLGHYHARALALADEARRIVRSALATGFEVQRKSDGSFVTSADFKVEERLRALIQQQFPDHGVVGEEYTPVFPDAAFQWILDPIDGTEDFIQRVPTFGTILALHSRGRPIVGVIDHPALDLRVSAAYGLGAYRNGERVRLTDLDDVQGSTNPGPRGMRVGPAGPATITGHERVVLSARANFTRYADDGRHFDAITRAFPNHRIYRSCFAHTLAVTGQADATVDYGNRLWDVAASQILIEEAGGKYTLVQDFDVPRVGRIYSTVFGKPALVDRLVALMK